MRLFPRALGRGAAAVVAALALCCLGACAGYAPHSAQIRKAMVGDDLEGALGLVDKLDSSYSRLLYHYEKGLILHHQGRYQESNEAFEASEQLIEELYTKSLTREIAALAITDNIAKYRGDPFETVLVNYYQILNYLHMGDLDGALVECRQVNRKLQMIIDAGESSFENDPFLQYLSAMVYELAGERTEAEVSYRVAVEGYEALAGAYGVEPPRTLFCDAARNARALGDGEEAERFENAGDCDRGARRSGLGRLNLFFECGFVAGKVEQNISLPILKSDDWDDDDEFASVLAARHGVALDKGVDVDYWLRVALPSLVESDLTYDRAVITAVPRGAGTDSAVAVVDGQLVENLDALARIAYDEGLGKVLVRATLRALIKYGAKKAADKEDRLFGAVVNIFGVASESADTRSWSTLPQRILMARLDLPEGAYDVHVEFYDVAGAVSATMIVEDVRIRGGRSEFKNYRLF